MLAYNYTTIEVLEQMLQGTNKDTPYIKLRATESRYVISPTDRVVSCQLLRQCVGQIEKELSVPNGQSIAPLLNDANYMNRVVHSITSFDDHHFALETFLSCFSECRDDANLWIRYAHQGEGIAICFDTDLLKLDYSKFFNVAVRKCVYWPRTVLASQNVEIDHRIYKEMLGNYKSMNNPDVIASFRKIYEREGAGNVAFRLKSTFVCNMLANFCTFNRTEDKQEEREIRLSVLAATPEIIYYKQDTNSKDYLPAIEMTVPFDAMKAIILGPKCGKNAYG